MRGRWRGRRVGVLMGGRSREREVSLASGAAVLAALERKGYDAVGVDPAEGVVERLREARVEVAFLALHGRFGEDGRIQGLLEWLGIPYTGSGVEASAVAMDKLLTKLLWRAHDLPTADFWVVSGAAELAELVRRLGAPVVVKPVYEGSSLGVEVVRRPEEAEAALERVRPYGRCFVERFVRGRELTCGLLNGDPLPLVEVVAPGGLYDFHAKYHGAATEYRVPAELDRRLAREIQGACARAAALLGCRGGVRVDLLLDTAENFYLLEVNTLPGMTDHSLLPKAAAAMGIGFDDLVEILLDAAPEAREG
ncbi:MAG: D-alanine--D-alanine ligase [Nitrospirae bacterium]|nr:MAG: D-alanine--D-alanine ligase [Nitrospirota bacterium]